MQKRGCKKMKVVILSAMLAHALSGISLAIVDAIFGMTGIVSCAVIGILVWILWIWVALRAGNLLMNIGRMN